MQFKKAHQEEVTGPSIYVAGCIMTLSEPIWLSIYDIAIGRPWPSVYTFLVCIFFIVTSYIYYKKRKNHIIQTFSNSSLNNRIHIVVIYAVFPACLIVGVIIGLIVKNFINEYNLSGLLHSLVLSYF